MQKTNNKSGKEIAADEKQAMVAVAGHICLDIIPSFGSEERNFGDLFTPGRLVEVGPAVVSTGGAVSNTGLALHRLGVPTVMIGKVGRDFLGDMVLNVLRSHGPGLAKGMIVDDSSSTSYTIVISPPKKDRMFFHCSGANDVFGNADIDDRHLGGIRLFHFGYPPLMRKMYRRGGEELKDLFQRIREKRITTSLDMAKPDPTSEAGRKDWNRILERVLPYVDIFLPSLEEILYMIDRKILKSFNNTPSDEGFMTRIDTGLLDNLADRLINMGTLVVVVKLGNQGLYLRSGANADRLSYAGGTNLNITEWTNRQLLAPCFHTHVAGTTGAGDCTIAGLLAGLLTGISPIAAITAAVGVGACSTETSDATSGIPSLKAVFNRVQSGWQRHNTSIPKPGWQWDKDDAVWKGPLDRSGTD
ncbi:MAG TPA: carbohydrate kinase family protein [Desulfobacterales bacterium]|nr:carbohydrate kinase family protein [Desulfobacterales bacterium]